MLHPTVFNTAQVCYELGIKYAVLSPGSRNAPLLISFARHEEIDKYIIPDERSAGFVALGIAQETKRPVVLSCTSGSALLNYAPAIAEAYYREIPLIVLSADRPPELIDQRDGQTIRQYEALKNHVKASYQLPLIETAGDTDQYQSLLTEGIAFSEKLAKGPVHFNIPFREPFYPDPNQDNLIYTPIGLPNSEEPSHSKSTASLLQFSEGQKILILLGQSDFNDHEKKLLCGISAKIPVIRSPLNNLDFGINHVDGFISEKASLQPDILITTGLSVLSKNLKNFLRAFKPKTHYHFDSAGVEVDTFGSAPKLVMQTLFDWLPALQRYQPNPEYMALWRKFEDRTRSLINDVVEKLQFSEVSTFFYVFKHLPANVHLHLSNSMPIRYADLFGVPKEVKTHGNRGTSGIDGCTSTAVGVALVTQKLNILITGDLAFLYDRNAFFHNHKVSNLRIVIVNNQGGGIFRLIKGPSSLPELGNYFETAHNRTAEYICQENGLTYLTAFDLETIKNLWNDFLQPSDNAKVLEVFTKPETNQKAYRDLRNKINEHVNN